MELCELFSQQKFHSKSATYIKEYDWAGRVLPAEVGTAALLSSAATSAAVFSAAVAEALLFFLRTAILRCSSDQRSSASVKIIDLPLPLLQKKKILKTV